MWVEQKAQTNEGINGRINKQAKSETENKKNKNNKNKPKNEDKIILATFKKLTGGATSKGDNSPLHKVHVCFCPFYGLVLQLHMTKNRQTKDAVGYRTFFVI